MSCVSTKRSDAGSSERSPLEDPRFRSVLVRALRRRVPEIDAEDIVQAAITEAVAAGKADEDPVLVRRWIAAVARNRLVDHFRKKREVLTESPPDIADVRSPHEADLLRWAELELPDGQSAEETLEWMLREAEGESLEEIAKESNLPPARVRKRVSRLREHFRQRWAVYASAFAAIAIAAALGAHLFTGQPEVVPIAKDAPPDASTSPRQMADDLRRRAFEACGAGQAVRCVELLDDAARLDPAGDTSPEVVAARDSSRKLLAPPAPPSSDPVRQGDAGPSPSGSVPAPSPSGSTPRLSPSSPVPSPSSSGVRRTPVK
jgi:RNA polymerase sigma factor (sigma-70 family)